MFTDSLKPKKKLLNSERIGEYVEIAEGQQVHYYEAGIGPPLILVHGLGQSLYCWHDCIEVLSKEHHVYALDLPGFGYSDKSLDLEMDIDSIVSYIIAFMDAVGVQKAHIIGNGSGGIISLRLLELYSQRVGRMSVIAPGGLSPSMPFAIRSMATPAFGWMSKLFITRSNVEKALSDCFFDQTRVTDELIDQYYLPFETENGKQLLARAVSDFDEEETLNNLRSIEKDVQIIWGIDDRWHPVEINEDFHISITNSEVHKIRNCGHLVAEEKIKTFSELVIPFLKDGIRNN